MQSVLNRDAFFDEKRKKRAFQCFEVTDLLIAKNLIYRWIKQVHISKKKRPKKDKTRNKNQKKKEAKRNNKKQKQKRNK